MFAFTKERAEKQLHYRTLMVNWMFAPQGLTFGKLAQEAEDMWDKYLQAPPDPTVSWGRWRSDAARALGHLRGEEIAQTQVRFICETQLLLRPYLEGRLKMHLLYKVIRADDGNNCTTILLPARRSFRRGRRTIAFRATPWWK